MVRTSYQPVYRPRQVVFRDLTTLGGNPHRLCYSSGQTEFPSWPSTPCSSSLTVLEDGWIYLVPFKDEKL